MFRRQAFLRSAVATAPIMHFLKSPRGLSERVDEMLQTCTKLLGMLDKTADPVEKHDIIDTVSNVLCLQLDACEMVVQVHDKDSYKEGASDAFQAGHAWMCETNSRRDLYDHLMSICNAPNSRAQLGEERWKNVMQLRRDMENNGIHLPDAAREEIVGLNMKAEDLAKDLLTTQSEDVLMELLETRHTLGQKLGLDSFAASKLRGSVLDTPEKVWDFLLAVNAKYRPRAESELAALCKRYNVVEPLTELTDVDRMQLVHAVRGEYAAKQKTADVDMYYTVGNCIRGIQMLCEDVFGVVLKRVAFDPDEVLQRDCQKYHCYAKHNNNAFLGVIILDMFARESKLCQGGHITVQLGCRPHAAVLEKAGLAKTRYAGADNGRQYPIVFLTCNAGSRRKVARRADGSCDEEATPMAPHEVTTAFHEFGHALHTIFGQTGVQNLAGTRGSIDFVECFSQLFEHFLTDHDFVKRWAVNRGVPIPKDVVLRTAEATSLFRSVDTLDQVVLSAIDQTLHGPQPFTARVRNGPPRILGGFDAYLNSGAAAGGLFGRRKQTPRYAVGRLLLDIATPFSVVKQSEAGLLQAMSADHLSSYPGGYYGYLYSGAFARRIWEKCFRDQPMNLKEGERLCDQVLQYGAACNAREVLQNYLGEPLDNAESWA